MNESEMTASLLTRLKAGVADHSFELEKHYNHYGTRGSVDIVDVVDFPKGNLPDLHVYELKSASAVEESTGPNEIIRQFNKHKQFFFEGQEEYPPYRTYRNITFYLVFNACESTIDHLNEYLPLYHNSTEPAHGSSKIAIYHEDFGVVYISGTSNSVADANAVCKELVDEVVES